MAVGQASIPERSGRAAMEPQGERLMPVGTRPNREMPRPLKAPMGCRVLPLAGSTTVYLLIADSDFDHARRAVSRSD